MRKLVVVVALVGLAGGSIFCGSSNSSGGTSGGTTGGSDAGGSGSDAGTTGGSDAGTGGGSDAGTGGSDAGTGGGSDAGTDAGTGGTDAGTGGTGGSYATACSNFTNGILGRFADCEKATTAYLDALKKTIFTNDYCGETGRAVSSGRAVYDDSKASACLSAIQGASCAALQATIDGSPCSEVLKGTVAAGGACYDDVDCAAGSCDASALTCPGRCVAFVTTAGSPCNTGTAADCAPGLTCQANVCVTPSAAGGACPCKEGLYCDTNSVCQTKKTSGSCGSDSECALGTTCAGGSCRTLVAVGSPCTPPTGNDVTATECGFMGAYCEPSTSKCTAWPGLGQSCAASFACQTGYCDVLTTSTCVAFRNVGQSCDALSRCASGAYCDQSGATGTCTALKANGASCTSDGQCQSDACAIPSGQAQGQCKAACVEP